MKMIWDQCPGKTTGFGFPGDYSEPIQKIATVCSFLKYFTAFDSPSIYAM
jgi:hypothetical protein